MTSPANPLVDPSLVGKRVSVFMMSAVKNVGQVERADDETVTISFNVEGRDGAGKREMHVTMRQDRIESVGVLS